MKHTKFLIAITFLVLWMVGLQVSAAELNSWNIVSYGCTVIDTTCNLSSTWITSIASWTFTNHMVLQTLDLSSNQLTGIENGDFYWLSSLVELKLQSNDIENIGSWAFNGLDVLQTLVLYTNQLTGIENWDFNGLPSLLNLKIQSNQMIVIITYIRDK